MRKTAKTVRDYTITAYGYEITIPAGSAVSNKTACGYDNNYRFWESHREIIKEITGYYNSILSWNITHYGINIPKEYCEDYPA
jgi:hypothetical protein